MSGGEQFWLLQERDRQESQKQPQPHSPITPDLLDQLLANYKKPEDLTGADGLFKQLKKALIERALGAELTEHLGYAKGDPAGRRHPPAPSPG